MFAAVSIAPLEDAEEIVSGKFIERIPLCHQTHGRGTPATRAEAISAGKEHAKINAERLRRLGIEGVYRLKGCLYERPTEDPSDTKELQALKRYFFPPITYTEQVVGGREGLQARGWLRQLGRKRRVKQAA